jgi:hypothetical protein
MSVGSAIGEKVTLKVVPELTSAPVSVNWSVLEVPVLSDFTTIINGVIITGEEGV